jgi:hypothetical protein
MYAKSSLCYDWFLLGNVFVTGHESGRLNLYNVKTKKIREIYQHWDSNYVQPISDIELINLFDYWRYIVDDNLYSEHHHVISVSRRGTIAINSIDNPDVRSRFCDQFGDFDFEKVKVCGEVFAVTVRNDATIKLFQMVIPPRRLDLIQTNMALRFVFFRNIEFTWQNFVHLQWTGAFIFKDDVVRTLMIDRFYIKQSTCGVIRTDLIKVEPDLDNHFTGLTTQQHEGPQILNVTLDNMRIIRCFSFYDDIFILLTDTDRLFIDCPFQDMSVSRRAIECPLNTVLDEDEHINTVELFGSLLAVGTNFGSVFIYHFPNYRQLDERMIFDLSFYKKVCNTPIKQIIVKHGPIIIINTAIRFVIFKWSPVGFEHSNTNTD